MENFAEVKKQKPKKGSGKEKITYVPKYTLTLLTKGRLKNTAAHHEFLTVFLKPTYADKQFREAVQGGKEFSDIVSVSDEAFAKLLMINSWSRWEDINQIHENKFRSEKRSSEK